MRLIYNHTDYIQDRSKTLVSSVTEEWKLRGRSAITEERNYQVKSELANGRIFLRQWKQNGLLALLLLFYPITDEAYQNTVCLTLSRFCEEGRTAKRRVAFERLQQGRIIAYVGQTAGAPGALNLHYEVAE